MLVCKEDTKMTGAGMKFASNTINHFLDVQPLLSQTSVNKRHHNHVGSSLSYLTLNSVSFYYLSEYHTSYSDYNYMNKVNSLNEKDFFYTFQQKKTKKKNSVKLANYCR